jgi:hypothetical protein
MAARRARTLLVFGLGIAALLGKALFIQLAPAAAGPTDYSVTLALTSATIVPGQTVYATMTVKLPGGQPANNVPVTFSSSGDVVFSRTTCPTNNQGWCNTAMTVGGGYGSQTITGRADPLGQPNRTDSKPLFEYDAPASLGLSLSSTSLQKDGISASTATATPRDAQGRPVMTLQPVQISDTLALASPVKDNHDGTYTSTLTAPPPKTPSAGTLTDAVTATVSSPALNASSSMTLTDPPVRLVGPLRTSGTQILDGNNNPVRLKGLGAVNWASTGTVPTLMAPAHVGNAYLWGANSVRLMLSANLYLGDCPGVETYPPNYRDALQREVDLVTSYGMLAVLDLHLSNPNCATPRNSSNGVYGIPVPLPPKVETDALFADLAARYGGNSLVAFELYNEPFVCGNKDLNGNWDGTVSSSYPNGCPDKNLANQAWVNGGTVTHTSPTDNYLGAGMKSIYDKVRASGAPNSLVFIDANGFASDARSFDALCSTSGCLWPGTANVVYTFHYYGCQETDYTNRVATCSSPTPESCTTINSSLDNELTVPGKGYLPWNVPVDYNEFGWPQAETKYQYPSKNLLGQTTYTQFTPTNHGRFLNNVISYYDSHAFSWSVFAYGQEVPGQHSQWQGPYTHVQYADTVPWTPNDNGQSVKNGLQGLPLTCY